VRYLIGLVVVLVMMSCSNTTHLSQADQVYYNYKQHVSENAAIRVLDGFGVYYDKYHLSHGGTKTRYISNPKMNVYQLKNYLRKNSIPTIIINDPITLKLLDILYIKGQEKNPDSILGTHVAGSVFGVGNKQWSRSQYDLKQYSILRSPPRYRH